MPRCQIKAAAVSEEYGTEYPAAPRSLFAPAESAVGGCQARDRLHRQARPAVAVEQVCVANLNRMVRANVDVGAGAPLEVVEDEAVLAVSGNPMIGPHTTKPGEPK